VQPLYDAALSSSVIEDCGALLACAITAASLALVDAGIDCKVQPPPGDCMRCACA
jgi:ribonuclease PH